MLFLIRPSKIFLFSYLKRHLNRLRGLVGLDAGSANFKNRWMFHTKRYYGLDRNLDLLRAGLAKYNDSETLGIYADLVRLEILPDNSVDVVVSTNTLNHLNLPERKLAVHHLCRLTKTQGFLFCELSLDSDFADPADIIKSYFENIQIIYYRNPISRFYESIFEKDGDLSTHPIAGRRPFRALAWCLSRLEYLTCAWPAGNRHALIIGSRKRNQSPDQVFDLSRVALMEDRIYRLMENA